MWFPVLTGLRTIGSIETTVGFWLRNPSALQTSLGRITIPVSFGKREGGLDGWWVD